MADTLDLHGKFLDDMVRFRRWLDDPEFRDHIEALQQRLDDLIEGEDFIRDPDR